MKKILATILACMTLSTAGMDMIGALETTGQLSQDQDTSSETGVKKFRKRGPRGHRGHRGHRGKRGKTGSQGAVGTSVTPEFGEAYIILGQTGIPVSVGLPAPVSFTDVGQLSSDVSYDPTTWTFTISSPGTYTIEYGATACTTGESDLIEAMILGVVINGGAEGFTVALGTSPATVPEVVSSPFTSFVDPSNQITRTLAAGATITLVAGVSPLEGGGPFSPVYGLNNAGEQAAYISIEKIG